jgi:hypothetical protein
MLSIVGTRGQTDPHLVRLVEEYARQFADLRWAECRAEHTPLRAVRRALGDEDALA